MGNEPPARYPSTEPEYLIRAGRRALEDRRPAGDLGLDEGVELRRRTLVLGRDRSAKLSQPLCNAGIVQGPVESVRQLVDDLLGRALRCENPRPDAHLVVDPGFLRGRDVWQRSPPPWGAPPG